MMEVVSETATKLGLVTTLVFSEVNTETEPFSPPRFIWCSSNRCYVVISYS